MKVFSDYRYQMGKHQRWLQEHAEKQPKSKQNNTERREISVARDALLLKKNMEKLSSSVRTPALIDIYPGPRSRQAINSDTSSAVTSSTTQMSISEKQNSQKYQLAARYATLASTMLGVATLMGLVAWKLRHSQANQLQEDIPLARMDRNVEGG